MRAIIDRIEGDYFLVECEDETTVQIPTVGAPASAREGAVIELTDGRITAVDEEATAARAAKLRARLERLKRK